MNREPHEFQLNLTHRPKIDPPVCLVCSEEFPAFNQARRRESQVKHWTRAKKETLVAGECGELRKMARRSRD